MARKWVKGIGDSGDLWEVTSVELGKLKDLADKADRSFRLIQSANRTKTNTTLCTDDFAELTSFMRDLKKRRLTAPPLGNGDLASLGLRPSSSSVSTIPAPLAQATAVITFHGPHLLRVGVKLLDGATLDMSKKYGFRIHYGILQPQGVASEETEGRRYQSKPPVEGDELPLNLFTRRRNVMVDFSAKDSGKTVFFCICIESPKGEKGPWGPIVSSIIP
jgi:hypothetical protein